MAPSQFGLSTWIKMISPSSVKGRDFSDADWALHWNKMVSIWHATRWSKADSSYRCNNVTDNIWRRYSHAPKEGQKKKGSYRALDVERVAAAAHGDPSASSPTPDFETASAGEVSGD